MLAPEVGLIRPAIRSGDHALNCLLRQSVESDHSSFKVFFLRVLNLIVAEPVKALNEHHHGGDPRPRHFGGIVKRT